MTDSANFSDTSIRRRDSLSYVSKVDLQYEPNDDELRQITQLQRALNNTDIKNESSFMVGMKISTDRSNGGGSSTRSKTIVTRVSNEPRGADEKLK